MWACYVQSYSFVWEQWWKHFACHCITPSAKKEIFSCQNVYQTFSTVQFRGGFQFDKNIFKCWWKHYKQCHQQIKILFEKSSLVINSCKSSAFISPGQSDSNGRSSLRRDVVLHDLSIYIRDCEIEERPLCGILKSIYSLKVCQQEQNRYLP